ncbi:MAG: hypothetical protein D6788_01890 [Planctomycetota bacterium]|nr:MAG: hypothetical protein D6788_01890 [Planctomycetota bacterium]
MRANGVERKRPVFLHALGRAALPERIEIRGTPFIRRRVFKDDFFAVTALYEGPSGPVVLKVHRTAPFGPIPLQWMGRWLARRERQALTLLDDVDGVPRLIDRWGPTGVVREFIPGRPLQRGLPVPDDFHPRLHALIARIHERGMAYVDLEKAENVLLGDDGRPYLFDFQISWWLPRRWGGELWPLRTLRRWLQAGDRYHLIKLRRRTRPDQLDPQELADSYRRPWHVRLHRWITYPFTWCRRRILDRIDPRRDGRERGTVVEEDAVEAA